MVCLAPKVPWAFVGPGGGGGKTFPAPEGFLGFCGTRRVRTCDRRRVVEKLSGPLKKIKKGRRAFVGPGGFSLLWDM